MGFRADADAACADMLSGEVKVLRAGPAPLTLVPLGG